MYSKIVLSDQQFHHRMPGVHANEETTQGPSQQLYACWASLSDYFGGRSRWEAGCHFLRRPVFAHQTTILSRILLACAQQVFAQLGSAAGGPASWWSCLWSPSISRSCFRRASQLGLYVLLGFLVVWAGCCPISEHRQRRFPSSPSCSSTPSEPLLCDPRAPDRTAWWLLMCWLARGKHWSWVRLRACFAWTSPKGWGRSRLIMRGRLGPCREL